MSEVILELVIKSVLFGTAVLYAWAAWIFYRAKGGLVRKLIIGHFLCGVWTFGTWSLYLFSSKWDYNVANAPRIHSLMFFCSCCSCCS